MTTSDPHQATPDVQSAVAHSADAADLFATAPALLLELQVAVGELAAAASRLTERGRRPFRADDGWAAALGDVAYRVYLLADQSGVQLDRSVQAVAERTLRDSQRRSAALDLDDAWPLKD